MNARIFLAILCPSFVATALALAADLPSGSAEGSLTYQGNSADLKFAGAFIDREDDKKPTILVISDQKLPFEKWNSEFDMMHDQTEWSGVVFFLNRDGTFYRSDVHMKGRQASVSGFFALQWSDPSGKSLSGNAQTEPSEKETKLKVSFNAPRP